MEVSHQDLSSSKYTHFFCPRLPYLVSSTIHLSIEQIIQCVNRYVYAGDSDENAISSLI